MNKQVDSRHKTTFINVERKKPARKLSYKQGMTQFDIIDQFNDGCMTPTSNKLVNLQYSNRDSGRIHFSPFGHRNKQKSNSENIQKQIRAELSKLPYGQKLNQIQYFLKNARQLCKYYGYFSVTLAMLNFRLNDPVKIQLLIHPDSRSNKPLHPIKKATDFQSQLYCVSQLKILIRNLFPTIDLGNGRTFSNVIAQIQVTKADLESRKRRVTTTLHKQSHKNNEPPNRKIQKKIQAYYQTNKRTMKTAPSQITTFQLQINQPSNINRTLKNDQQHLEYQDNRKRYKNDQKYKQTASTLLQSFRSANSIKQKLRVELSSTPKNKQFSQSKVERMQRDNSPMSADKNNSCPKRIEKKILVQTQLNRNKQYLSKNISLIHQTSQQNISQMKQSNPNTAQNSKANLNLNLNFNLQSMSPPRNSTSIILSPDCAPHQAHSLMQGPNTLSIANSNSKSGMKISVSGKKLMSMSIQMEKEINSLFGNEDTLCGYYEHNERRAVKNSMLSKVAEEFEDLF